MSNTIKLHCAHCGAKLKIKDHSLFGQSVKCPSCKNKFILRDPNETIPDASEKPAVTPVVPAASASSPPREKKENFFQFEEESDAADSIPFPPMFNAPAGSSSGGQPVANPFADSPFTETPRKAPDPNPPFAFEPPAASKQASANPMNLSLDDDETAPLTRELKKKHKAGWFQIATTAVIALGAIGLGIFYLNQPASPKMAQNKQGSESPETAVDVDPNQPYSRQVLQRKPELVDEFRPTSGKAIELYMMPSGVNMVIHLRPAKLWSDAYDYKVLRASLTDDFMSWLEEKIRTLCLRDPAQIEELTIGVLLGARGSAPQYACVVKLVQPEKMSTLLELFPGKYLHDITARPDFRVKVTGELGYLIHDEQTYAICPAELAPDLEYSIQSPNHDISAGMAELLERTDRDRLLTVAADIRDLQIHLNMLIPSAAQPFMKAFSEWLGENVEQASWSVHPEPYFHSELALKPISTRSASRLEEEFNSKLAQLPEQVWKELCNHMQPREVRFRKIIGRFPAMLEAFRESTISRRDPSRVILTTVLPAKATPNLALATMFTIDEASRTTFAVASTSQAQSSANRLPEKVVDRMKIPVDAEIINTPFEQAVTYLCNEIQVKLVIDGDALKDAGYTKNMKQSFNLGKVPMQRALFEIVNNYQEKGKEMVISIDEATTTITVHTKKFAEQNGMPIHNLTAE